MAHGHVHIRPTFLRHERTRHRLGQDPNRSHHHRPKKRINKDFFIQSAAVEKGGNRAGQNRRPRASKPKRHDTEYKYIQTGMLSLILKRGMTQTYIASSFSCHYNSPLLPQISNEVFRAKKGRQRRGKRSSGCYEDTNRRRRRRRAVYR